MQIPVTKLRAQLAETLAAVARGERVEVQRHGRTIAVIGPAPEPEAPMAALHQRLATLADQRWAAHQAAPVTHHHRDLFGPISEARVAGLAYADGARQDLALIRDPAIRGRIEKAIVGLVPDPRQAPPLPQATTSEARHLSVAPWHILYRPDPGGLLILAMAVEPETGSA